MVATCVEDRERGFALLIVLWSMVLLALLGSTITAAGRSESRIAGNLLASAQAEAAADGAVAQTVFHLIDGSGKAWVPGPTPYRIQVGGCAVVVTLADQRGKIDPNSVPPGIISALLRDQGVAAAEAKDVADALTDWRSADNAGLTPAYTEEGRRYGPPHEAFESLDEIALTAHVTPRILAMLRPHFSLFLDQTPFLPQSDPVVAAAVKDATGQDHLDLSADSDAGPLIVLVTAAASDRGAVFTRRALLRLNPTAAPPYEVLDWDTDQPS
jgi:general secretion pathway protein K